MAKILPTISAEYKKEVRNSVILVLLFFIVYALLISLSVLLIIYLGYFAFQIIENLGFRYWSIILSVGVFSIGVFIFIFLVKFVFSSFKNDNSSLIEINRFHEPELYKLIDEVVEDVGTQKPKKIFLSPDVNAYVSYNSVFWSMILPIKKNLTIGLGLINTTNVSELKAILAHEFGHFSQRSMKIGSYVNQANKIIHSTLYNNDSFNNMMNNFASLHAFILIFAKFSLLIISGIKWILQKTYEFLYKKHMSLSRQMEFHADSIATTIVGTEVKSNALLRLDLSETALLGSVNFYRNSTEKYNTKNIFENQTSLMLFFAEEFNHKIEEGLPKIQLIELQKYQNSKLKIEDQWASHPTLEQRITKIRELNIISQNIDHRIANSVLKHFQTYAETLTQKLLAANGVNYTSNFISNFNFMKTFEKEETKYKFPEIFNSYYNQKNLPSLNLDELKNEKIISLEFFTDEKVNMIFEKNTIENELETLELIRKKEYPIKTFEYDGRKYYAKEALKVKTIAENRLKIISAEIEKNDRNFLIFLASNLDDDQKVELNFKLNTYNNIDESLEKYQKVFQKFIPYTTFMSVTMSFDEIRKNRFTLIEKEKLFKEMLKEFMENPNFKNIIIAKNKELFEMYINSQNKYFEFEHYIEREIQLLSEVFEKFSETVTNQYFETKKDILEFEAYHFKNIIQKKDYSTVLEESSSN